MNYQIVSSKCKLLRKLVEKYYSSLDNTGKEMVIDFLCNILNERFIPQTKLMNCHDKIGYFTIQKDLQMIISEYNSSRTKISSQIMRNK